LSPLLFNFFIDDVKNTLMHNCNTNPVVIGDVSLNIPLYADDIVLLSESKEGLQNSLDEFDRYCSNWKLQLIQINQK
jgi:hypothetical protein